MTFEGLAEVVDASSLAELCWVDGSGAPRVRGVVALLRDGRPVVAFNYSDEPVAREVARARSVALALTEPRSTGQLFRPMLVSGRPRLVEDPTGDLYAAELVTQELTRYPPARLFAGSQLLMRENWWYLPRLVVEIDVEAVEPLSPRAAPRDLLLVVADGATPVVRVAGIEEGDEDLFRLDVDGGPVPSGPAVLFGQDASFPALEQWSQWSYRGTWDGAGLVVEEVPSRPGLGRVPGLVRRWTRQRAFERRCVRAIPRTD